MYMYVYVSSDRWFGDEHSVPDELVRPRRVHQGQREHGLHRHAPWGPLCQALRSGRDQRRDRLLGAEHAHGQRARRTAAEQQQRGQRQNADQLLDQRAHDQDLRDRLQQQVKWVIIYMYILHLSIQLSRHVFGRCEAFKVSVTFLDDGYVSMRLSSSGKEYKVRLVALDAANRLYQCEVNGDRIKLSFAVDPSGESSTVSCFVNERLYEYQRVEPKYVREVSGAGSRAGSSASSDLNEYVAPMPGIVDKIHVKVGDAVKKGDALVVMIAMKMEYVIKANKDGVVKTIACSPAQNVKKLHKLVLLHD